MASPSVRQAPTDVVTQHDYSREELHKAKRALFSQLRILASPDRGNISYLEGLEEHRAAGKTHAWDIHFPGPDDEWTYRTDHWGQRVGKTLALAAELTFQLSPLFRGTLSWVVAPNYGLTKKAIKYVWKWVVQDQVFGPDAVVRKSFRDPPYIEMEWGSLLEGKSAENTDQLVGDQLDFVGGDEVARWDSSIWFEHLLPRLANRRGKAMLISSPRGYNWYQQLSVLGVPGTDTYQPGWRDSNARMEDNIYIDPKWIAEQRAITPTNVQLQDFDGKFVSFSGLVYPDYVDRLYDPENPGKGGHLIDPNGWMPFPLHEAMWVDGIDIGISNPTAATHLAVGPGNDVVLMGEYQEIHGSHAVHARNIASRWPHRTVYTSISHEAGAESPHEESLGVSPLDDYAKNGIYATLGPVQWSGIVSIIASYLRATLQRRAAHPRLFISRECIETRKQFLSYVRAERKSQRDLNKIEAPKKSNDHLMDALRLILGTQPRYEPQWIARAAEAERSRDPITRYGYQGTTYAMQMAQAARRRVGAAGKRRGGGGRRTVQVAGRPH